MALVFDLTVGDRVTVGRGTLELTRVEPGWPHAFLKWWPSGDTSRVGHLLTVSRNGWLSTQVETPAGKPDESLELKISETCRVTQRDARIAFRAPESVNIDMGNDDL